MTKRVRNVSRITPHVSSFS